MPRGEAAHRGGKAVLKIQPAIFAVRDYIEPQTFLESHRITDCIVFDAVQLRFRDFPVVALRVGLFEMRRTQQAADHVGSDVR